MKRDTSWNVRRGLGAAVLFSMVVAASASAEEHHRGEEHKSADRWLAGDFHNHTYLTDGSNIQADVLANGFRFGLDWIANSEHGGTSARTPQGTAWPADTAFLGNPPAGKMWRWQSLLQYSFPIIAEARNTYPEKLIVQGYEWNVPTHEHASVAIVGPAEQSGKAIAQHEYLFDASDSGTSSDNYLNVTGKVAANSHDKAVAGARWLQDNYPKASYFLINHPSRAQKYSVADIRDFNNAAPDVAFGFEGVPGHQKESSRGGYGGAAPKARTYGGADYMVAQVGGLWDALLGEGRHFYTFVNSDFHNTGGDFWPGEYAKSYTFVRDENHDRKLSPLEVVNGLRSGNSFAVHGDLISALELTAQSEGHKASMGSELHMDKGGNLKIKIRFKSPSRNNNGDSVNVDHIDLIAGDVTGKAARFKEDGVTPNPNYNKDTNESTRVIATFTSKDWEKDEDGYRTIVHHVKHLKKDTYFRLRGTNLAVNTPNETDAQGNPLIDDLMAPNNPEKAYVDLWFYSNPLFVRVSR